MAVKFQLPSRGARVEWRLFFLALGMLAGLGALVAKLWWEQVARGPMWAKKIANRSEVTVRIPGVRGEIRDRNGVPLVTNRASYEVDFYLPDMVRGFKQQHQGEKLPQVTYRGTVKGMAKDKSEADIVQIVNTSVIPRLQDLDLAVDYNSETLRRHYRNDTEVPFTYREEIDFKTLARFSEHDVGLPGVDVAIRPVRQYVFGALAAHLLGYVGAPNDVDLLPDVRNYSFYQPDVEGKSQVEGALNKYISGTPGVRVLQRNVKGQIEGELRRIEPKQGANVYLTIDARVQYITERALRVVGRGAAVVVNPKNGDILAMASVPSYDPNVFIPSIDEVAWKQIIKDDTDPLTNRAIQGYAPGSTYKVVAALAGLRKGLTSGSSFTCYGGVSYGNKYMKCWIADKGGSHGGLTLSDALKVSCNAFFYQWGNAAGIDNIVATGKALGLGEKTGVPLTGEDGGILPGPDWLKSVSPQERWSQGYTANVSIGQGSVEASPLQMAMVIATVANRGTSFRPRLVDRVVDQEGRDVRDEEGRTVAPPKPDVLADLRRAGIGESQIELVRRGMWKVVNEGGGTGKRAQVKGVEVAGKTGTAQFWRGNVKDNHTWFICFAPYQDPKYAICVMVQGAKSGGGVSAPIAQRILEETLALEQDPNLVTLTRLEPARGSFAQIEAVEFKEKDAGVAKLAAAAGHEDQETADHVDDPLNRKKGPQLGVTPDIRPGADSGGRLKDRAKPKRDPNDKRNFIERFFGFGRKPNPAPPQKQPFRR
ncbi:MAG: penicillin-binding protein 2 [Chthoniobacteraceae bacterium]